MLYTNIDGSRRIRVFNYALTLVDTIEDYFEELDSQSVMSLILKEMINSIYSAQAFEPSMSIIQKYTYGRFMHNIKFLLQKFKNQGKNFQNLSNFPKYFLGILKSKLFHKNQTNEIVDFYNYVRSKLLKMQSIDLNCYIYPKIYDLNNIFCDDYESPKLISCAKENLEKGGIYLIDNGFYLIIYLTKNLENQNPYFNLLFENITYTEIMNEDTLFENEFNDEASKLLVQRLKKIIENVRTYKILFQTLTFVVEDSLKQNM
jgi:protein transport protein SEC24